MTYVPVSVKKGKRNAGRPRAKASYILIVRVEDVIAYTRDANGVKLTAFALAEGKKAIGIFQVPTKNNVYESSAGEAGVSGGQLHHADFVHPGEELAIKEFAENNTNEPLIAIQVYGDEELCKIAGTPGNPLWLTVETKDDNSECANSFKLAQSFHGACIGLMDKSLLPGVDQSVIDSSSFSVPGI